MIASTSRSMASAVIDAPDSACDVDVVDNGVVDDVGTGSIPGFIVVSRNLDVGDYECPVEGLPVDDDDLPSCEGVFDSLGDVAFHAEPQVEFKCAGALANTA